ncbi:transposase, partial [Candidatus Gracilibacteria bacterium]|nr:transposase [Candidatus Gracilibacteria bacterium]NJM89071.1 transposase [Hydrococcus sp. RU_2_2]
MKLNQHLKEWKQTVSYRFPQLSLPQVSGLATWSFGMVMTRSSSLTRVSHLIAKLNQEQENTVRQRLKEWYKEGLAKAKKGNKRVSLEVKDCFASLVRWIVELLPSTTQELPIALDATSIGANFTVLSINWLILTDFQATDVDISWYRFRCWIECSYRDLKSDGWQWQKTRLRQPDRAERH